MEVSKSVLKSKMLSYFRQVEETGEELVVTHNQVPVLRITPFHAKKGVDEVFAPFRGQICLDEDVLLSSTTDEWGDLA